MRVFYAQDRFPEEITLTLFLMGPTPRTLEDARSSWREEALSILQELGFGGEVFVPEPRDGRWADDYTDQVAWENEAMHRSDRILVWLPRDMRSLPGLTTNDEWGYWKGRDPARLIFGAPPDAPKVRYQQYYARELGIPVFSTLADVCRAAARDKGERRRGGECQVPLHVWRTQTFRAWYEAQKQAGNTLRRARVEWVYRLDDRSVFYWALRADLYVSAESRHKSNEVVLGRPDVAAAVLYRPGHNLLETEVVLVREFRSPARTPDGFVLELPSGSPSDGEQAPVAVAVAEVQQETGMVLDLQAVHRHEARQLVGPLAVHQAFVFSAELSDRAMTQVRAREAAKSSFGVAAETEQTHPCVRTVREILADPAVDWSTLGMILRVLQDRFQITCNDECPEK
jgi:8-oxo-dGTP pyrophosphatase MutT (NUDIX family)